MRGFARPDSTVGVGGGTALGPVVVPAVVVGLGVVGFGLLPEHLLYAGSTAIVAGLIGLGLYLPLAVLRELPLNAAAIAGLSAYVFAFYGSDGGIVPNTFGVVVALIAAVIASTLGGVFSLVVTGLYFAVASLVVQVGIEKVVFSIGSLTGGNAGRSVAQPYATGWLSTQRLIYLIAGMIAMAFTGLLWYMKRQRTMFRAVLVGWQPEGAAAVGLRGWPQKLLVFAIAGLLVGAAGCLSSFVNGTPPPPIAFGVIWSVIYVSLPIASGLKNIATVWLVAIVFVIIPIVLESHSIDPNVLSGTILLIAIVASQSRDRLLGRLRSLLDPGIADTDDTAAPAPRALADHSVNGHSDAPSLKASGNRPSSDVDRDLPATARPILEVTDLVVRFGGITAVDGVSLTVKPGQRVCVIGANGAGKSTLVNAISGFAPTAAGTIRLGDTDLAPLPSFQRARLGIGRTFQLPRVADVLSIEENVLAGHGGRRGEVTVRTRSLLERFGLWDVRSTPIAATPFGIRRKAELVRALVAEPQVLLIDEPVSGLEDHEVTEILGTLLALQAEEGWGLLVIEHDQQFIAGIAEEVIVMENGRVIGSGGFEDVFDDDVVRRIYLGEIPA